MNKLAAAAVAALTASATVTSGCIAPFGCGVDDATMEGEWGLNRMFTASSPCPAFIQPATELWVFVDPDEVTIQESDDVTLVSSRRWTEGDRELVELVVNEVWLTSEAGPGFISTDVVYQLELVRVTGRLEGTVSTSFVFDTPTAGTTCTASGAASAGRLQAG